MTSERLSPRSHLAETCPACNGSGFMSGPVRPVGCSECRSTGRVVRFTHSPASDVTTDAADVELERLRSKLAEVERQYDRCFDAHDRLTKLHATARALLERAGEMLRLRAGQIRALGGFDEFDVSPNLRDEISAFLAPAPPAEQPDLREKLAALAHEQWSGWMRYLFERCRGDEAVPGGTVIPAWASERWRRQMATLYEDLTEGEKESDRKEADRVLAVLRGGA